MNENSEDNRGGSRFIVYGLITTGLVVIFVLAVIFPFCEPGTCVILEAVEQYNLPSSLKETAWEWYENTSVSEKGLELSGSIYPQTYCYENYVFSIFVPELSGVSLSGPQKVEIMVWDNDSLYGHSSSIHLGGVYLDSSAASGYSAYVALAKYQWNYANVSQNLQWDLIAISEPIEISLPASDPNNCLDHAENNIIDGGFVESNEIQEIEIGRWSSSWAFCEYSFEKGQYLSVSSSVVSLGNVSFDEGVEFLQISSYESEEVYGANEYDGRIRFWSYLVSEPRDIRFRIEQYSLDGGVATMIASSRWIGFLYAKSQLWKLIVGALMWGL